MSASRAATHAGQRSESTAKQKATQGNYLLVQPGSTHSLRCHPCSTLFNPYNSSSLSQRPSLGGDLHSQNLQRPGSMGNIRRLVKDVAQHTQRQTPKLAKAPKNNNIKPVKMHEDAWSSRCPKVLKPHTWHRKAVERPSLHRHVFWEKVAGKIQGESTLNFFHLNRTTRLA